MTEVLREVSGRIATLTINRPDRRNTMSPEVIEGLRAGLRDYDRDPNVGAIVITGAGEKAFCAGGDVSSMSNDGGMLGMHWAREGFADLLIEMNNLGKPTIAKVNGLALGGGFGLALNCDLAVASSSAQFGTPEIKIGVFPMMIMAVMSRNLARKDVMELMLTGDRIDAERALSMGVVNRVAADGQLEHATLELANQVASYSPAILKLGRRAFYQTQDMDFESSLRRLHAELSLCVMSEDATEGVMAFLERREPQWQGR